MKKPIVFSVIKDQSVFMTAIMSLLTFLAVIALGMSLAIGTGVIRWNSQWDLYATVQIMDTDNTANVKKIFDENTDKITHVTEITTEQMREYLVDYQKINNCGKTTIDNVRRNISSFFSFWLSICHKTFPLKNIFRF